MVSHGVPAELAAQARELLRSRRALELTPFLQDWPSVAPASADTQASPSAVSAAAHALPALRWLTDLQGAPDAQGATLTALVRRHAPTLEWRQTYTAGETSEEFLRNYAWTGFIGPHAPIASTRIACGVLLLGAATLYPAHRHEAEEIYVPLSGRAHWRQGDHAWRERLPGDLIHHAGNEPHSMRTDQEPLLALYVWRGGDLHQKAQLHARRAAID